MIRSCCTLPAILAFAATTLAYADTATPDSVLPQPASLLAFGAQPRRPAALRQNDESQATEPAASDSESADTTDTAGAAQQRFVARPLLRKPADPNDWSDLIPLEPGTPPEPTYIVLDARRYPLPVLNRTSVQMGGGYLSRAPYADALARLAPDFAVDIEDAYSLNLGFRLRLWRYLYAHVHGRYDTGDLAYVAGTQRERYDFTNSLGEFRLGVIAPVLPTLNLDLFAGGGAYDFDVGDGDIADLSGNGTVYGGHLTALLRWGVELQIGYHQVAASNDRIADENSQDTIVALRIPWRPRVRLTLDYASGTERYGAGLAFDW